MNNYRIFTSPLGPPEAVKQGWSWPAFFFSFAWALVKKMWILGVGIFIFLLISTFMVDALAPSMESANAIKTLIKFLVIIPFGISGNYWREKHLVSRGYREVGLVSGTNPDAALVSHLST